MEEGHDESAKGKLQTLYGMTIARQEAPLLNRRTVSVCVDDYGLHEGINQAALNLARLGRISAISCLVDGPAWLSGANALKEHAAHVEIGLHLNFTENFGKNLFNQPLPKLILSAYTYRLNHSDLMREIQQQLAAYESSMGRKPDFIDGHQHVHQLPCIRAALLEVLDNYYPSQKPWIRASCPPENYANSNLPPAIKFKSKLIGFLGASALSSLAKRHGYSQNRHLLGVYGFDVSEKLYLDLLQSWLQGAMDGDVLMCHPSLDGHWNDPLLKARWNEYRVLSGEAYSTLAEWAEVEIGTLSARKSEIGLGSDQYLSGNPT